MAAAEIMSYRKVNMNRKITGGLVLTMLCAMLMTSQIFAVHTRVGRAASRSYVQSSYTGRVIIFAGDSRVMYLTTNDLKQYRTNCAFAWVNGGNVTCISGGGKLRAHLNNLVDQYRNRCVVVLSFGINGNSNPVGNAARIKSIYREFMSSYPDVPCFVESTNPSGYSRGAYSNKKINKLNALLRQEFGDLYIDTSTYLLQNGIVSRSGAGMKGKLHYTKKTKVHCYTFIKNFLASKNLNDIQVKAGNTVNLSPAVNNELQPVTNTQPAAATNTQPAATTNTQPAATTNTQQAATTNTQPAAATNTQTGTGTTSSPDTVMVNPEFQSKAS